MTDSEGEAQWNKMQFGGATLAQEELAAFERNLAAEISRSGPLPMSEISRLTGYEEKDCRAFVIQSGKLRVTSDGSATVVKKHRRPVAKPLLADTGMMGRGPAGMLGVAAHHHPRGYISSPGPNGPGFGAAMGGGMGSNNSHDSSGSGGQREAEGRVGYLCIAEEFKLEEMRHHYEEAGYHTKLAFDVLHVSERQAPAAVANNSSTTPNLSPSPGSTTSTANQAGGAGRGALSTQRGQAAAVPNYGSTTSTTDLSAAGTAINQTASGKRSARPFDLFIFAYGAVVFWGYDQRHYQIVENDFVLPSSRVNRFISGRYPATTVAANFPVWCNFSPDWRSLNPNEPDRVFSEKLLYDHFYIPQDSVDVKLCVSHGLAQSAKIDYIEIKVTELTQSCKPLPRELKDKGSVTISERKLLQLRGEVLFYRLMLKSGSDLLDEPELFWQFPWLKPFYTMTKQFFDISERVETLDAKLEAANQIVTMIGDQFNQRHGSRLEWIVIWLVMVEVIIGLLELILDIKPWVQ